MEKLQIPCSGYDLPADWYQGQTTDKIILNLYGFGSKRQNQVELMDGLVDTTGASALVFDYSGHGEGPFSLEETSPAQHFLEAIHTFDWIREKYPATELTVIGSSYGGFLAAQLAYFRTFPRLILRAPAIYEPVDFYTLWRDIDRDRTREGLRRDITALAAHPLLLQATAFPGRTLVMVHEHDDAVPIETTDAYIRAFAADIYEAKGLHHALGDPRNPREAVAAYRAAIGEWMKQR